MSSEVRYTRTPFSLLPHRQVVHIGMGKRVFIEWGHHNPEDPGCLPCTSGNAPPPPPRRRIHLALLSQHGTARVVGLLAVGFVAGWPAGDTAAAWRPGTWASLHAQPVQAADTSRATALTRPTFTRHSRTRLDA